MKYDDLTLMQYADGELEDISRLPPDDNLMAEEISFHSESFKEPSLQDSFDESEKSLEEKIKEELLKDKKLQSRLEVFTTTKRALTSMGVKEEIPTHIHDLIDNYVSKGKKNWITKLTKKYPVKTTILSTTLTLLIAYSLVPQVATKGLDFDAAKSWYIQIFDSKQ